MDKTLENLLTKLTHKKVFFDFDGVLMTYQATESQVHITEEDTYLKKFVYNENPFFASRAPERMKDFIATLNPNDVFVLSAVGSSFESQAKNNILAEHYPTIPTYNIIYTGRSLYKAVIVEEMYDTLWKNQIPKTDVFIVEDNPEVIKSFESKGFSALHISSFL